MKCQYLRVRSEKYQKYYYCFKQKKKINTSSCSGCIDKCFKKYSKMKNRSKKLSELERKRDKNIIKCGECDYCHRKFKHLDPHEVYGGSNRKRSIENCFVKKLCRECHSDEKIINQLRIDTQKEFEKTHSREEFISLIGKSYLKNEEEEKKC